MRIGKPIDSRECLLLRGNGVELFIEKALIDKLPDTGSLISVYMGDYGCWTVGLG